MVIKSLPTDALASARSVTFRQQEQSISAQKRAERILCIGNAAENKNIKAGDIYLSTGNADDIGVSMGFGSPLHRMANKLFPANGNGSKVDTYFMPVKEATGANHQITVKAAGESKLNKTIYLKLYDQVYEAAADVAGKVATNAQQLPHKDPSGIALNIFENTKIPFTVTKGMSTMDILNALKDALDEYPEVPFNYAVNEGAKTSATIKGTGTVDVTTLTETDYAIKVVVDNGSATTVQIGEISAETAEDVLTAVNAKLTGATLSAVTSGAVTTTFILTAKSQGAGSNVRIETPDSGSDLMFALKISGTASGSNDNSIIMTSKFKGESCKFDVDFVTSDDEEIDAAAYGFSLNKSVTAEGAGVVKLDEYLDNIRKEYGFTRIVFQFNDDNALDAIQEYMEKFRDGLIGIFAVCYTAQVFPESETNLGTVDIAKLVKKGNARRNDAVNITIFGDYGRLRSLEWSERNKLLKAGISNLEPQQDGSYEIADLCTYYHPEGVKVPLFKYDRNICITGNIANDMHSALKQYQGCTVIGEDDHSSEDKVIKLSDYKALINSRIDLYGESAWIGNVEETKKATVIEQDKDNPDRFNINTCPQYTAVVRNTDVTNICSFMRTAI